MFMCSQQQRNHLGGITDGGVLTCEKYEEDATTGVGRWSAIAPLPKQRVSSCVVIIEDRILILGGSGDRMNGEGFDYDSVDEYNPTTDTWRILPWKLPQPRFCFAAVYHSVSKTLMIAGSAIWSRTCLKLQKVCILSNNHLRPINITIYAESFTLIALHKSLATSDRNGNVHVSHFISSLLITVAIWMC
jgi:hypothetical protein